MGGATTRAPACWCGSLVRAEDGGFGQFCSMQCEEAASATRGMLEALEVILAEGGLEAGAVHRGRREPGTIHAGVASKLVAAGLAEWCDAPARPTPRPPRRQHARLRRWLDRERRGTVPTLFATAAGCRLVSRLEALREAVADAKAAEADYRRVSR